MENRSRKQVVVIGAGPAGMMAAIQASKAGAAVTLLERNSRVGRKLGITGKGRCNVTTAVSDSEFFASVISNPRFLYSAFSCFSNQDTMRFFEEAGVPLKIERGDRVFPVSDQARDIIDAMAASLKKHHVRLLTGFRADAIRFENGRWMVSRRNADAPEGQESRDNPSVNEIAGDALILALGGNSYHGTGSTGDGYRLAQSAGHSIVDLRPGLNALNAQEAWVSSLQGLTLKNVQVKITDGDKTVPGTEGFGEMLFTHFGVSGPLILTAESCLQAWLLKKKRSFRESSPVLHIDLKKALSSEELAERVKKDLTIYAAKNMQNAMVDLLPVRMILPVLMQAGIQPEQKAGSLSREERNRLVQALKDLRVSITSARPIEEAIITMGGVNVKEINPKTLESKLMPGLFFAGEMMDVDALTGGYNLQIAFSSGALAGRSAAMDVQEQ